jgi:serine/threonine protein kinase
MVDRRGKRLGHYRLVRLLGRGGFAEVYLGEHLHLKTQVAVKVLYTALQEEDIESFLREAQTVARLKHPHIVRVFDFDVQEHTPYLVMDYLPNGSIRRLYPRGTVLPLAAIVSYVTQIASALQYAHDEKVIHRDVKPENMLLDRDNSLVLSDFGIALMAQSSHYQSAQEVAGTAAYMAPEQFQGHPHRASDQYALGIVAYEWLSGDRPFHGTFSEIASQHMFVPPPLLSEKVPDISPDVEQVVRTALEKDPKQRFGSVLAFAIALEQASQVKQLEPELIDVISETTDANQSQQPTKLATTLPAIPLSLQTVSEVSEDKPTQPHSIMPLSEKEQLRQAEEERARQEKDLADKLEEERVWNTNETALAPTELAISAHQTPLSTEVSPSSKPPAIRPNTMMVVKSAKPSTSRRFVLLGLAGLLIVALASGIVWLTFYHASSVGSTTDSTVPTAIRLPFAIVAGSDSNLWFTSLSDNEIGRISPSGTISSFWNPSLSYWITAGPDGNLWFTANNVNEIGRISPSGTIREFPIPTNKSTPAEITAGPDGNLWFTEQDGNEIGRISPSGTIREFPIPTNKSGPVGITAGPNGNLWFTEFFSNEIGRISPSGMIREFPIPTNKSGPVGITAGPNGNLWFTERDSDKIGSISPSGMIREFPIPTAISRPFAIVAGPDGNLWFTEFEGNKIGRISPSGTIREFPVPTAKSGLVGITAGPDGNLWFTESNGDKIGRISLSGTIKEFPVPNS